MVYFYGRNILLITKWSDLMTEPKFMINNIDIINSSLKIEAVSYYSGDCVVPKIRIIFNTDSETRRLPLVMRSSFKKSESNIFYAFYSYTFNLDYIFSDKANYDSFTVCFEMTSGNNVIEKVGFALSKGLKYKFPAFNIDDKFIAGDEFDGTTVFSPNKINYEIVPENLYSITPEPENKRFTIKKSANPEFSESKGIHSVYNFIQAAVVLLIAFALLPYFVIDGILAGLNISPKRKAPVCEGFINITISQIKANIANFIKNSIKDRQISAKIIAFREEYYKRYYKKLCKKEVVKNRVSFISGRRDELGGNEKYVYDLLKDREDIDFRFLFSTQLDRFTKSTSKKEFYKLYATSKVVIVDDYYNLLNTVEKRDEVMLFQLWHACGAFKTFGFSRLGKPDSPKQSSPNHRMYDFATVSSSSIIKYYAEGFGITDSKVIATGIPRTDIFFDKEYAENYRNSFYEKYPYLKNKKIILFAPTFRGAGQKSAYYPTDAFDPNDFIKNIGEEYAVIIKLHPFCSERYNITKGLEKRIIDLSDEDELNDLLFVTDLLITDYSSCVFEASLMNIPMLFYAYDLFQYISERDFYCDFETFVPGKIVFNIEELTNAVNTEDYNSKKIEDFRNKFFEETDGRSTERVAKAVIKALNS